MFGIVRLFVGLAFLTIIFGFGYLWGSQKTFPVQTALSGMRSELTSKIEQLEHSLRRTRIRMELFNARNHLVAAQTAIRERNYGEGRLELLNARNAVIKVAESADEPQKKELVQLAERVRAIQERIDRPNPPSKAGIEEAIRRMDQLLS